MAIAWRQKSWALPPTPLLSPLVDFSCHLESVCCMAFQQYDNLYGFGRGLQRLFGSATSSFTFRCIQWVSSPLPLPLCLSFCPLFSLTLYSFPFFPAYRSGSAPPSYSHHADRSAGHQRGFISHSETASSLMDGSAILFNSPPLRSPTPPSSPSLSLPTLTPLLACSRSLASLSPPPSLLPPVLFPPSLSNHSMRDYILRLDTRKIHEFLDALRRPRITAATHATSIPNFTLSYFDGPPFFVFFVSPQDTRSTGLRSLSPKYLTTA